MSVRGEKELLWELQRRTQRLRDSSKINFQSHKVERAWITEAGRLLLVALMPVETGKEETPAAQPRLGSQLKFLDKEDRQHTG